MAGDRRQRSITKPNRIFMGDPDKHSGESIHGIDGTEVADIDAITIEDKPKMRVTVDDPMEYNARILSDIPKVLDYVTIPSGKLLVRFLKRPFAKGNIEVIKTKILVSEHTEKTKEVIDDSAESKYIGRFVVVKIGSKNANTENIEVGDILDGISGVNYAQYFCPIHKEKIDQNENFYLIPDSYYSFIWKTKNLPAEQRVKTSLIP